MKRSLLMAAAAGLGVAPGALAQLTFQSSSGNFQDITNIPGTVTLNIPFNGYTTVNTVIGNSVFPSGTIKVGYNATLGSNVGAAVTGAHAPLPSTSLYGGQTALAVLWDTPDPPVGTTQILFREFFDDPEDQYYIVQWNNLPMGGGGGVATVQTRVNNASGLRAPIFALLSYADVNQENIFGGAFSTIGYQSGSTDNPTVQWSFDERGAVSNGQDLVLTFAPAPGGLLVMGCGVLAGTRRRRGT